MLSSFISRGPGFESSLVHSLTWFMVYFSLSKRKRWDSLLKLAFFLFLLRVTNFIVLNDHTIWHSNKVWTWQNVIKQKHQCESNLVSHFKTDMRRSSSDLCTSSQSVFNAVNYNNTITLHETVLMQATRLFPYLWYTSCPVTVTPACDFLPNTMNLGYRKRADRYKILFCYNTKKI